MAEPLFKAKYTVRPSIRLPLPSSTVAFKVLKSLLVAAIVDGSAIKLATCAVLELPVTFTVVCVCIVTPLWNDAVTVYVPTLLLVRTTGA